MKKSKPEWVKESCCPKCGCPIYARNNGDGNPPEVKRTCDCVAGEWKWHYSLMVYPNVQPQPFEIQRTIPWWERQKITCGQESVTSTITVTS